MELAACMAKMSIRVQYEGSCSGEYSENPFTDLFEGNTNILCPTSCPEESVPVCGDDDITYRSECHLRMEECTHGTKVINVKHEGPCSRCRNICTTEPNAPKVCGSDGITYESECAMKQAACTRGTNITVVFQGACGKCDPVTGWMCRDTGCIQNSALCD